MPKYTDKLHSILKWGASFLFLISNIFYGMLWMKFHGFCIFFGGLGWFIASIRMREWSLIILNGAAMVTSSIGLLRLFGII